LFWVFTLAFAKDVGSIRQVAQSLIIFSIFTAPLIYNKLMARKMPFWFASLPLISISVIYLGYFLLVPDPYFRYSKNLLVVLFAAPLLVSFVLFLRGIKVNKKLVFSFLLIALLVFSLIFTSFAKRTAPWEFISEEEVIQRYYPGHFEVFDYIDDNLPEDAKILSLYNQKYYVKREMVMADSPRIAFLYGEISLSGALEKIKSQGIG